MIPRKLGLLVVAVVTVAGLWCLTVASAGPQAPAGVAQGPPAMSVAGAPAAPGAAAPPPYDGKVEGGGGLAGVIDNEPLPGTPYEPKDSGGLIAEENKIDVTIRMDTEGSRAQEEPEYVLEFHGHYVVRNPEEQDVTGLFAFPFPANTTFKWDTRLLVDGKEPADARFTKEQVTWSSDIPAGRSRTVDIGYKTRGSVRFAYQLPHNYRARNLDVTITIIGSRSQIEIPGTALEPTEPLHRTESGKAWSASWAYEDVVLDRDIEVLLAGNHKPAFTLAALDRLRWLAVVFVALFLLALGMAARIERREIAPHEYLLAGVCFFMFYPLLVFASGYVALPYALALSLAVISAMIVRYVSAVSDLPFALKYAGSSLLVFLGFSCIVILAPKAIGIATVVGALVLIALFMEVTGRRGLIPAKAPTAPAPRAPAVFEPQPDSTPSTGQEG